MPLFSTGRGAKARPTFHMDAAERISFRYQPGRCLGSSESILASTLVTRPSPSSVLETSTKR